MDKRTVLEQINSFEDGRPGIGSSESNRAYRRNEWISKESTLTKALKAVGEDTGGDLLGCLDNPEIRVREDGQVSWIAHPSNMRRGLWMNSALIRLRAFGFDYRISALNSAFSREHFEVEIFEMAEDPWPGSVEKMKELIHERWYPQAGKEIPNRLKNHGYLI